MALTRSSLRKRVRLVSPRCRYPSVTYTAYWATLDTQRQQKPRRRDSPVAHAEEQESSGESADDYVQEKRSASKGKARVKARGGAEGGERRAQRKRKRRSPVPENQDDALPGAECT